MLPVVFPCLNWDDIFTSRYVVIRDKHFILDKRSRDNKNRLYIFFSMSGLLVMYMQKSHIFIIHSVLFLISWQAFSSDGKSQTIRALEPEKEHTIGRVYRKELSFTDVKIVNLMYKCSGISFHSLL